MYENEARVLSGLFVIFLTWKEFDDVVLVEILTRFRWYNFEIVAVKKISSSRRGLYKIVDVK